MSLVLLLVAVAVATFVGPDRAAEAAPTVPFTPKFSTNANGAIISLGNNLLTCPASAPNCPAARNGASLDNNSFAMVNLDADGVGSTFNSSMSRLSLPAASTVLWAGLYWGARLDAGTQGSPGTGNFNQMSLRVPGSTTYQTITASSAARDQFGPNPSSDDAYQRFADVTGIVRAAGNGDYWGANVVAGTGADRYAGWSLTVVYEAPGLPLRNLTVFDGFDVVTRGAPQTVRVSGFQAPLAGTVDAQLSMVAYEGDLAQTGDFTRLNNTQLATALSPGSNFFDSANDRNGQSVTTRTPADRNMLGFDIKNLGASGTIPNGATSATFTFSSNGDVYFPGVLTTAINLYAPDFTASSKTVTNLSGNNPARPGDTLQYTLNYANTGQDPAVAVVSEDPLPPNTTYVPGSLRLLSGPGAPATLTDEALDDRGEIDGRTVRVRLGAGATATAGGTMDVAGVSQTASYSFQVTLDAAAGGTTVSNVAELDYRTGTTDIPATFTTPPAATDVARLADVAVTKAMSPDPLVAGGQVTSVVTVTNNGPNPATAVRLTDPPSGITVTAVTVSTGAACAVPAPGQPVDCTVGDLAAGETATVTIVGTTNSSSTSTTLTNVAQVATSSIDPNPADNLATAVLPMTREADLRVAKSPSAQVVAPGEPVSYTVTVTNAGASDATNVTIADLLSRPTTDVLSLLSATSASPGVSCAAVQGASVVCTLASLPAGQNATVTVDAAVAASATAGTAFTNTAVVSSQTADPNTGNNVADVTGTVGAPSADVRVTKAAEPSPVVAGGPITYTVTATNWGPSNAAGVVVTDVVPAGVSVVAASSTRGTCTVAGQTVTCEAGTLPASTTPGTAAGGAVQVTITGTVAPDATGTVTNTATAATTPTTADPVPGNNQGSATVAVTEVADVAVSKRANRTSLPGAVRPVTYTITVRNNGPSAARDVVVSDLVPLGLDFVSATPQSGTCDTSQAAVPQPGDPDHGLVTCTLADPIPVGGTQTVVVEMQSPGDVTGGPELTETVTVSSSADDPNPDNNAATWTLTGLPQSDLELQKTAPATVTAGTVGTYQFTVTNHPTDENLIALAPTLEDTLPNGVTLVPAGEPGSLTPAFCTADGQDVTCQLPDEIAPNASTTVELSVRFDANLDDGAALVNTAEVVNQPMNPDPSPANNVSEATSTVRAVSDVTVTDVAFRAFTGLDDPPGDPITQAPVGTVQWLSMTITNNGPAVAKNVGVRTDFSESLPLGFGGDAQLRPFVIWEGVGLIADENCRDENDELICPLRNASSPDGTPTSLGPGQSVTVSFAIVIPSNVLPGSSGLGIGEVSTTTPESDDTNNVDDAPLTIVEGTTDLALTKTAAPGPGPDGQQVAGTPFSYQIQASMAPDAPGGFWADARNTVIEDTLPPGFTATSVSSSQGTCEITGGGTGIRCEVGTIAGTLTTETGVPVTVTVNGVIDDGVEGMGIPNTATATTDTPNLGDAACGASTVDCATAEVDVIEQADLQLFKIADAPTFFAGGTVGYTLTIVNAGPSDVEHAVITDRLPVGLTLDPAQSDCPPPLPDDVTPPPPPPGDGQVITCRVGVVEVGEPVSLRIVATTSPSDQPRAITNAATVDSLADDPDRDNNTASADAALDVLADVAITSSVSTTTPAAGGEITYTGFTINNGPSDAQLAVAETTFPPGFVPVRWDIPFSDCEWTPAPPADPASEPWRDVAFTLRCVPLDPTAPFPPGVSLTSVVVMQIPGDTPTGNYTGSGEIRTATPESRLDNNRTSQTVFVQHVSDTEIVKTLVEPNPMQAGRPATWRLTVTNNGPSVADNVVISDTVPEGMTFVSATTEAGAACPAPEVTDEETIVRCPVGSLELGESSSALVTFDIAADTSGTELCNAALVGSGSLDPDSADNDAEACDDVVTPPATDVGVTITPDATTVQPGDDASFTAVVRNNGPATATGVVLTIDTPPGLTDPSGVLVSAPDGSTAVADCVIGSLICTIGTLEPGQEVIYRIVGTASVAAGTDLTLTATVTHNEADTDPSNDTAEATVEVVGETPPPTEPGVPPPTEPGVPPPTGPGVPPPTGPGVPPPTGPGVPPPTGPGVPPPTGPGAPPPTGTTPPGTSPGGVSPPGVAGAPPAGAPFTGPSGAFPFTGADLLVLLVVAFGALLTGTVLRASARRRRPPPGGPAPAAGPRAQRRPHGDVVPTDRPR